MADVLQFRPALVPAFLALVLAPRASLRSWLAVSSLAPPQTIETDDVRKIRLRRALVFFSIFTIFLGTEYFLIAKASPVVFESVITAIMVVGLQASLMGPLADATAAYKWACYRAPSGRTIWRIAPGTVNYLRTAGVVLIAGTINAQTWIGDDMTFVTPIVTFALLYRFIAHAQYKTLSIRGIMLILVSWIAMSFVLSGIMVAMLFQKGAEEDLPLPEDGAGDVDVSPRLLKVCKMLTTVLFTAGPGLLIAVCYRFDHARHMNLSGTAFPEVEPCERRVCPSRRRCASRTSSAPPAPGAIIPTTVTPSSFPKTLYFLALSSWTVVQLVVTVAFTSYVPEDLKDPALQELAALALSIPVMVVVIVLGAWATGRAREMWMYKEEWMVLPKVEEVGHIRLAGEEGAQGAQSTPELPKYEEVAAFVIEDEVVPAYSSEVKG